MITVIFAYLRYGCLAALFSWVQMPVNRKAPGRLGSNGGQIINNQNWPYVHIQLGSNGSGSILLTNTAKYTCRCKPCGSISFSCPNELEQCPLTFCEGFNSTKTALQKERHLQRPHPKQNAVQPELGISHSL